MRSTYSGLLFLLLVPTLALGQKPEDEIKERYTKYEYRIPMRDGVKLFTAVYVPKDQSQKFPILMKRTPYSSGPYGIDRYPDNLGPSSLFWKEGYIFVNQDVRGRWMSEGEYVNMRPHNPAKKGPKDIDEASDTYDTVEWLIQHVANHNGRVGMWGISYPGFYVAAGMIDAHPALKAASPQAPINDWFMGDDWHHNGALMLPHCFNFLANFGKPRPEPEKKFSHLQFDHETPDGYEFFLNIGPLANADKKYFKGQVSFWNEIMQHPNYDEFWQARNLRPHLKNIRPAVMTVGGWFDAENLFGALETYRNVEKNSPDCRNTIVMGPWNHGGWSRGDGGDHLGDVRFNAKTSKFYQEKIELPFFEYHLKNKGDGKYPEAWVFETGTNVWRQYDNWPPKQAESRMLYFHEKGRLTPHAPASADTTNGFDEYISDPAKPVPFYEHVGIGMTPEYMVGDQRQAGRRPDVLMYQTDVLTEDISLVGPVEAKLNVSTSSTDSDWIVKLIDVYPYDLPDSDPRGPNRGAYEQLIRGDVFRGRFRNSFEKPEAFVPNEPTSIHFKMQDICHTFRTGHRIMIQVQSTWFPLVDRNPQTFVENIAFAKESDFQKATERVYRTKALPSGVQVLVMP